MSKEWYHDPEKYPGDNEADLALVEARATVLEAALGQVVANVGAEGAVAADAIEIACSLVDGAGVAIAETREVFIRTLAVTDGQGDLAAAGTPIGTVNKIHNPAAGDGHGHMTTTAAGLFSFRVTDTVAETCGVHIVVDGCVPRILKLTFA